MFETVKRKSESLLGRIVVLTGARQTGKTTVVKHCLPDYTYISIEDPIMRNDYAGLTAAQWAVLYPQAILDEVQKLPQLIESIKAVYDQFSQPRYALLGSSQFLLLKKVRESLAGRCVILEIFPLILPELRTKNVDDKLQKSFFAQLVNDENPPVYPSFTLDPDFAKKQQAFDFYLRFGGYPALTNGQFSDDDRMEWLANYVKTFLERDVRDLAAIRDLEPFVKLQQYLAATTANVVNYSSVAKETGITVPTAQRYIKYLELSYQAIVLPAWFKNQTKRLVKSPKIHFMDYGVLQAILRKRAMPSGDEFESSIVAEIYKQIKTYNLPLICNYLRTQDGREVDLLLEAADYFIAIEIKKTEHVKKTDVKNLIGLQEILNKPLKKRFVLSNDKRVDVFDNDITAMHAVAFLC
jgi:predicted AAA+ superfamily ATPase